MPVLFVLIGVMAFLYFRGASTQAALNDALRVQTPNTAATGVQGTQGTANDNTFNHVLDAITQALKTTEKALDTDTQKY